MALINRHGMYVHYEKSDDLLIHSFYFSLHPNLFRQGTASIGKIVLPQHVNLGEPDDRVKIVGLIQYHLLVPKAPGRNSKRERGKPIIRPLHYYPLGGIKHLVGTGVASVFELRAVDQLIKEFGEDHLISEPFIALEPRKEQLVKRGWISSPEEHQFKRVCTLKEYRGLLCDFIRLQNRLKQSEGKNVWRLPTK